MPVQFHFLTLLDAPFPARTWSLASWTADPQTGGTAVALIAAAWLAFAVWAIIRGARAGFQARIAQAWGERLRGLLTTVPGAYLIIGADGSVTASDTLRGWLNIDKRLATLADLQPDSSAGLVAEDFDGLSRDAAATALSGQVFRRLVRPVGSGQILLARGRAAPVEVAGEQGVIIWFRDASEDQSEIARLRADQQALRAELSATLALIDAAPLPIWRRDADLGLGYANAAYITAVHGASVEAVIADRTELTQNPLSPMPRIAAQRARDLGENQIRDEPVIIGEARRMLEIHDVPLAASGVAGFAFDVTARDEARAERDRSEAAQTETLNRLSSGVALFGADQFLGYYNRAFCDLFRIEEGFLAERPHFDRVLEKMQESRRLPESPDFPNWRRERRGWFTDTAAAHEEIWPLPDSAVLRVIGQPRPDGGLLLVFEDRTEQLRLASARDTLVRVQQATLDNLYEAVAVFGADGRLQLWNRRFKLLWNFEHLLLSSRPSVDQLLALSGSMVVMEGRNRSDEVREIIRVTTATDKRESRQTQLELIDGRKVDFAAVPLPDGNVLFTYLDVTDRHRIESALRDRNEALEAADRLKSAFVANISYELRTPLTAISGFGEMLAAGYAGVLNARQDEYVGSILTSAERLQLLINDILDLAITEAGELALDVTDVDVATLVEAVRLMAEEVAKPRELDLSVEVSGDPGTMEGDERRLKQVLYKLAANAIRFTPHKGWVNLAVFAEADWLTFEVSDNGMGIPEGELTEVFDRFRKGSNAGSLGVGLGLALVKQFVDLHHGTVGLTSVVGEGTTVTVRLPRQQPFPVEAGQP